MGHGNCATCSSLANKLATCGLVSPNEECALASQLVASLPRVGTREPRSNCWLAMLATSQQLLLVMTNRKDLQLAKQRLGIPSVPLNKGKEIKMVTSQLLKVSYQQKCLLVQKHKFNVHLAMQNAKMLWKTAHFDSVIFLDKMVLVPHQKMLMWCNKCPRTMFVDGADASLSTWMLHFANCAMSTTQMCDAQMMRFQLQQTGVTPFRI